MKNNLFPKGRKILDKVDAVEKYGKDKGVDTVIVLDNDLVHTSDLVKAKLKQWE